MADPALIPITKDTWTKVATGVVTGQIHKIKTTVQYLHTYRLTGGVAPTTLDEAVAAFSDSDTEQIQSSQSIDVYLYCPKEDGKVRVDI
jgi:hypothetical protein